MYRVLLLCLQVLSLSWGAIIQGTIKDQYEQGVIGVRVTLLHHSTQDTLAQLFSDESGKWTHSYTSFDEMNSQNGLKWEATGEAWILHHRYLSPRDWSWYDELGQELTLVETQIGDHMMRVELPASSPQVYFVFKDSQTTLSGKLSSANYYQGQKRLSLNELSPFLEDDFLINGVLDSLEIHYEFLKESWKVTTSFVDQQLSLWRFSVRSLFLNSANIEADRAYVQVIQARDTLDFPLNLNMDSLEYSGDFYLDSAKAETYQARIYIRDSLGRVQSIGAWYPFDEQKPDLFDLPNFENGNAKPHLSASVGDYTSSSSFSMVVQLIDYEDLADKGSKFVWSYQKLHTHPFIDTPPIVQEFDRLEEVLTLKVDSGDYTMKWQLDYTDPDSNQVSNEGYTYVRRSFIDERDGQVYLTRSIKGRNWMIENLNYMTEESFCYDDQAENCEAYGRMYLGTSVDFPENICPYGWEIPTQKDWQALGNSLLQEIESASKVADTWYGIGDSLIISADRSQRELVGFRGLYGGYRWQDGRYFEKSQSAIWWSQTAGNSTFYYSVQLKNNSLKEFEVPPVWALNVRCIQSL